MNMNMKCAFLTESNFEGKVPISHSNMRTEMAWQAILQSDHYNLFDYEKIKNYDVVFVIFPKALVKLNMLGIEMEYTYSQRDHDNIKIYSLPIIETLKQKNKKVCYIQEGPSYVFTDYDLVTQFNFYNQLSECDIIFAHNTYDVSFYKGLFPACKIGTIPTLLIPPPISEPSGKQNKAMIGGNFSHWYNGFQSFIVASVFDCPISVPSMHCKRNGEDQIPNLTHIPYKNWTEWMQELSNYKYSVHLMPTVAAGTFSLNNAYFGIPCIGNKDVDTQNTLFPKLSVDVNDIHNAKNLAYRLKHDILFYTEVSEYARATLQTSKYMNQDKWMDHMENIING